jgi:hypothetical protein
MLRPAPARTIRPIRRTTIVDVALATTLSTVAAVLALATMAPGAGASATQAVLATDCTVYAAANGDDGNSGTSPLAPRTLNGASSLSQPGSVVCLKGGTYSMSSSFHPARSGTANAWIVYKAYGDTDVNIVWAPGGDANDLFYFFGTSLWNGPSYIEVHDLNFDGRNVAAFAFKCNDSHHLRFVGNTIKNMGAGGIGAVLCDYLTAASNKIYRSGYNQGWASGITFNSNQWYDRYPGFHSIVVNNIISGTFDASSYRTDGNGIIMDLSNRTYDASSADTPPALVVNNLVYNNGGRCIETYVVTSVWVVNNTCYKNALDLAQASGEIATNRSRNNYFVNNIAATWNNRQPYAQYNTNQNMIYYRNIGYGGRVGFAYADSSQFINADPLFVGPPAVDPARDGQYWTAIAPDVLGDALAIRSTSPAIDKGIDPTKIPGVPSDIVAGLQRYVFKDIEGTPRPQGAGFDIGAYEFSTVLAVPASPKAARIIR